MGPTWIVVIGNTATGEVSVAEFKREDEARTAYNAACLVAGRKVYLATCRAEAKS